MRKFRYLLSLLLLLSLSAAQPDESYVLLVSFDGFRPDYLEWVDTPNFDRLSAAGVRAESLQPVFPSKTFPNHYSLATGMYAEKHGLIANSFYDPVFDARYRISDRDAVENPRWYGGEPIWVTAERQGVKTASYFWVGSEAPIGGIRPSIWKRYEHDFPFADRVDSVIAWFSLPPERRPHLIMLYFHEPDGISHSFGPEAPETWAEIRELDVLLGKIIAGCQALDIHENLNLIIVSDHGMTATSSQRTISLADNVNLDGLTQEGDGPFSFIYGGEERRLNKVYKKLKKVPHLSTYKKADIPERWHFRDHYRIKDLLVVADEGWSILDYKRPNTQYFRGGNHGYDNALRSMQAIFIADGPAFKDGYVRPAFENVNVYPIIAEILALEPYAEIDGSVNQVRDILRP
ncbi:MAG: ectonucleotide pyrophosphatase/phosphodiesterase [Candidatus Neomarinimicrobiota bacterium]